MARSAGGGLQGHCQLSTWREPETQLTTSSQPRARAARCGNMAEKSRPRPSSTSTNRRYRAVASWPMGVSASADWAACCRSGSFEHQFGCKTGFSRHCRQGTSGPRWGLGNRRSSTSCTPKRWTRHQTSSAGRTQFVGQSEASRVAILVTPRIIVADLGGLTRPGSTAMHGFLAHDCK